MLVGLLLADIAGDGGDAPQVAVVAEVADDGLVHRDLGAAGSQEGGLALPHPLAVQGGKHLFAQPLHRPRGTGIGHPCLDDGALLIPGEQAASAGILIAHAPLGVGHADEIGGGLDDRQQVVAVGLRRLALGDILHHPFHHIPAVLRAARAGGNGGPERAAPQRVQAHLPAGYPALGADLFEQRPSLVGIGVQIGHCVPRQLGGGLGLQERHQGRIHLLEAARPVDGRPEYPHRQLLEQLLVGFQGPLVAELIGKVMDDGVQIGVSIHLQGGGFHAHIAQITGLEPVLDREHILLAGDDIPQRPRQLIGGQLGDERDGLAEQLLATIAVEALGSGVDVDDLAGAGIEQELDGRVLLEHLAEQGLALPEPLLASDALGDIHAGEQDLALLGPALGLPGQPPLRAVPAMQPALETIPPPVAGQLHQTPFNGRPFRRRQDTGQRRSRPGCRLAAD